MKINGVLGPIDTKDLGCTLMHEHVTCADWSMRMNFGNLFFDRAGVLDLAVQCFREAREAGITTMVDGTPINLGRDIELIREVAELSGMQIIASTGFYYQHEPGLASRMEHQIADFLRRECTEGINGTGILPGIFKAAVEKPGITDYNRKLLRSTGTVAAETGLPIFCHTSPAIHSGDEALDILLQQGVPARRIILGHSGDCGDADYLESLLKKGAWLGMDRFGYAPLEQRTAIVAELCRRGWANRLFLAHDASAYLCFFDYWGKHSQKIQERSQGIFTQIHREAIPELLRLGVTQADIDTMLTVNPQVFFEG